MPYAHPDVYDNGLNTVKNNATHYHICSAQPTNRAAVLSYSLASVAVSSADFTIANGDVSGRKITVAQKSGTVAASGTATHIAVIDATRLLLETTVTPQVLTAGNPVTFPTCDWEIRQMASA